MPFLDWVNKNQAKEVTGEVPYHLLKQEAVYGEPSENLLIQGDNLLALKALIPFYAGEVKCIFIDPPYNTQSAFEHYDDKLEHSQWLSMMYPRLVLLKDLLSDKGSIWVTVDDNESHYLKVLMDEIFGRKNFISNITWKKKYAAANDHKTVAPMHDHILVYQKTDAWRRNLLPRDDKKNKQYRFVDEVGRFRPDNYTCGKTSDERPNLYYPIVHPHSGEEIWPKKTAVWRYSKEEHLRHIKEDLIYWGKDGSGKTPAFKRYLHMLKNDGVVPESIWSHEDVGHTDEARKEFRQVLGTTALENDFLTPKPERLIKTILTIGSSKGDLVLDSFLGSGTTAAVAHKMGRRYIGIELGEHARTHCTPRLLKVLEGEKGGISESVQWNGGGGFRFCTLGEPAFDAVGQINAEVRFGTLSAFVWHFETGEPGQGEFNQPLLGIHNGIGYYLLYNGVLGDRRPASGNVLTHAVLECLKESFWHHGPKVVYGEATRLGSARLAVENITFKQIPYDIKVR